MWPTTLKIHWWKREESVWDTISEHILLQCLWLCMSAFSGYRSLFNLHAGQPGSAGELTPLRTAFDKLHMGPDGYIDWLPHPSDIAILRHVLHSLPEVHSRTEPQYFRKGSLVFNAFYTEFMMFPILFPHSPLIIFQINYFHSSSCLRIYFWGIQPIWTLFQMLKHSSLLFPLLVHSPHPSASTSQFSKWSSSCLFSLSIMIIS